MFFPITAIAVFLPPVLTVLPRVPHFHVHLKVYPYRLFFSTVSNGTISRGSKSEVLKTIQQIEKTILSLN